jgi:hypothetical protein
MRDYKSDVSDENCDTAQAGDRMKDSISYRQICDEIGPRKVWWLTLKWV